MTTTKIFVKVKSDTTEGTKEKLINIEIIQSIGQTN